MSRAFEVLWRFLLLGCASFGGPAAHMGYYRKAFVERLGWIDEDGYARMIALSQFLPGPSSSQTGFAIGVHRAGLLGGVCAFIGFTLPSFVLMYLLSVSSAGVAESAVFAGIVHGLKMLAVVVVADATLSMFRSFCKTRLAAGLCVGTAAAMLVFSGIGVQMIALVAAGCIGVTFIRGAGEPEREARGGKLIWWALALFLLFFVGLPIVGPIVGGLTNLFAGFYQTGSLVFGGGHVVLPLLQSGAAETISDDRFLLGYAAAQAVPGPMFTLASFLGAELTPDRALLGAVVATAGIFLPGYLLIYGLQGVSQKLAQNRVLAGGLAGLNAAVVGLLLAALYSPVFTSAVTKPLDFAFVIIGFYLLRGLKLPVIALVLFFALVGWIGQ